jgi:ribosome-associated toxin RatA of RatAB toxin-antitoxin module
MTTKVETSITVDVPISMAYNQWTQFEDFPEFMGGVQRVEQLDDQRLHWVAEIAGVKREWNARVLEQRPDEKIAWAATEGATNAGAVYFSEVGPGQTMVRLELEYEPEGVVEKAGDALNIVERQARADLDKFKEFIESRSLETGAWRGEVEGATLGTPGVESATSQGDSGKAGISGKAAVAGVAAAAAGAAAVAAARSGSGDTETPVESVEVPPAPEVESVEAPPAPVVDVVVVEDDATTAAAGEPVVGGDTPLDSDLPPVTDLDDPEPRPGGTGGTGV